MNILGNLYRLLATWAVGKRAQKAFCESCGVIFPESAPFVEGAGGLFCRKCIFDAKDRVNLGVHHFSENEENMEFVTAPDLEAPNPYTAPKSLELPCAFCGLTTSNRDAITLRTPYAVCRECLDTAIRIILKHETEGMTTPKGTAQAKMPTLN